jgi:hypothetical protein
MVHTKETFVAAAQKVHNNRYKYQAVIYINGRTNVLIECDTHGMFQQLPKNHLQGAGCRLCHDQDAKDKESVRFFELVKVAHPEVLYDYSETVYVHRSTHVIVKCRRCGLNISRIPRNFIQSLGCPDCAQREAAVNRRNQRVEEARKLHEDAYDYSRVDEIALDRVEIVCKIPGHPSFLQFLKAHSEGAECSLCVEESLGPTTNEFVRVAIQIHGDRFDYVQCVFRRSALPLTICCRSPEHGVFQTTAYVHLYLGGGCPDCPDAHKDIVGLLPGKSDSLGPVRSIKRRLLLEEEEEEQNNAPQRQRIAADTPEAIPLRKCPVCGSASRMPSDCCQKCCVIRNAEVRSTFGGFFYSMTADCIASAAQRKDLAAVCELTKDDFIRIWKNQQGRCYYSGIAMSHSPASDWRASPERLDETRGYVAGNCVLIVGELNTGGTQWSLDKISQLLSTLLRVADDPSAHDEAVRRLIEESGYVADQPREAFRQEVDGVSYVLCNVCGMLFFGDEIDEGDTSCALCTEEQQSEIRKSKSALRRSNERTYRETINGEPWFRCKDCTSMVKEADAAKNKAVCYSCHSKRTHKDAGSLRGCMRKLLRSAETNCNNKPVHRNITCDLEEDELISMFVAQNGRCYYSGMPLVLGIGTLQWAVSLERIDVLGNYTKTNCKLICREFNASDHSSRVIYSNDGAGGWNHSKMRHFLTMIAVKSLAK